MSEPPAAGPDTPDPAPGDPEAGDPEAGDPEAGGPEAGGPEVGDPEVGDPEAGDPEVGGPDPRTVRAVRGAFAATLTLEALVVLLVPRTIAQFGTGLVGWKLAVLLTLAGLLVVAVALLRRRAGRLLGTALQAALVACGLLTAAMFVLGAIFAAIWLFLLRLRRDLLGAPLLG